MFVVVEGALVYSVYKFRAKKSAVAAQIHGNTRLEIGWTVAAALILVVLTVVTFVKLPSIINPPNSSAQRAACRPRVTEPSPPNGKKLTICVQGRQYIWRYMYGERLPRTTRSSQKLPYSYQEMVVPANTTVVLVDPVDRRDPLLVGARRWAARSTRCPGYTTYTWFKAPKTRGLYHGQCAQLCGRNHAAMTALVDVIDPPTSTRPSSSSRARRFQAANAQVHAAAADPPAAAATSSRQRIPRRTSPDVDQPTTPSGRSRR